ncbi:O-antigen ligase family protein [Kribbia dieselivorans]|uniref:O-antigen ligase family protein n=1 Tax=Kribbia dieselivorans TaxID=331526 RepID=UPI0014704475|nr:O-antigen ligase family protein [Kribbia dieselivorans]
MGTVAVLLAVGYLIPHQPIVAFALTAMVFALAITFVEPAAVPLLVTPLLLVNVRVAAGGADLSVSDFVMAGAMVPAILLAPKPFSRPMLSVVWLAFAYQVATLFTVLTNPYAANVIEWAHAGVQVLGALMIGWMLGRRGFGTLALRLLWITGIILAIGAVISGVQQYASGGFGAVYPTYPFPMHKNYIGLVVMIVLVTMYAAPRSIRLPGLVHWGGMAVLAAAIAMAQARQSIVGLGVAIIVLVMRSDAEHKRSKIAIAAMIPALVGVYLLVRNQLESDNRFNSANQRVAWLQESVALWSDHPWVGVGLRFWYQGDVAIGYQPPNVILEMLTTAGLVGLAGFVLLFGGSLLVAWQMPKGIGSIAVAVLVARIAQTQFDLYWSSVGASVPFFILALCIGMVAKEEADREDECTVEAERPAAPTSAAAHKPILTDAQDDPPTMPVPTYRSLPR